MRDRSTYRSARKKAAREKGVDWQSTGYQRVDIRYPDPMTGAKGKALPLKGVGQGRTLKPSARAPGKFVYADIPEDGQ